MASKPLLNHLCNRDSVFFGEAFIQATFVSYGSARKGRVELWQRPPGLLLSVPASPSFSEAHFRKVAGGELDITSWSCVTGTGLLN